MFFLPDRTTCLSRLTFHRSRISQHWNMLDFWSIPGIRVAAYLGWSRKLPKLKTILVPSCVNEDAPRLHCFLQSQAGVLAAWWLNICTAPTRKWEWHHAGGLQNVQTANMMKAWGFLQLHDTLLVGANLARHAWVESDVELDEEGRVWNQTFFI